MTVKRISTYIIICLTIISCGKNKEKTTSTSPVIRPVKMVQVGSFTETSERSFPAATRAKQEVQLSFRVSGPLTFLNAEVGTRIKKGEVIAEIDSRDYKLAVKSSKAVYDQAKAEFDRYEALLDQKAVPRNEYEIKRSKYKSAEVNYENAKNALSDTKLLAPFNGFISAKRVQNFQEINAKQAIVEMVDLSQIEVQFSIPEQLRLASGNFKGFSVTFDKSPDTHIEAQLIDIGKSANPDGFPVTISIATDKNIFESVGLNCRVHITLQDDMEGVAIPSQAIFQDDATKTNCVWTVDKKTMTVHRQEITHAGFLSSDLIRIVDGLSNNDWIVIAGIANMKDGLEVKSIQ